MHELEAEFLRKQKENTILSEEQQSELDVQIEEANKRLVEFESEQEDLEAQMQYIMSSEYDKDFLEDESYDVCPHGISPVSDCQECDPVEARLQAEAAADNNYYPWCEKCPHGNYLDEGCSDCDDEYYAAHPEEEP